MVDFSKLIRRYDKRGNLLHTPQRTTRDLVREFDESWRERCIREARKGWTEYIGERRC